MDGGDDSRRQGHSPASEDPSREAGEEDRRQRSERGIGDLGQRDPVGMAERGGDQKDGIAGRSEVEGLRRQGITAGPNELFRREEVGPRVAEAECLEPHGGNRRQAHGEGKQDYGEAGPPAESWCRRRRCQVS